MMKQEKNGTKTEGRFRPFLRSFVLPFCLTVTAIAVAAVGSQIKADVKQGPVSNLMTAIKEKLDGDYPSMSSYEDFYDPYFDTSDLPIYVTGGETKDPQSGQDTQTSEPGSKTGEEKTPQGGEQSGSSGGSTGTQTPSQGGSSGGSSGTSGTGGTQTPSGGTGTSGSSGGTSGQTGTQTPSQGTGSSGGTSGSSGTQTPAQTDPVPRIITPVTPTDVPTNQPEPTVIYMSSDPHPRQLVPVTPTDLPGQSGQTQTPAQQPVSQLSAEERKAQRLSEADYFADALFIGDSRTVGLAIYSKLPCGAFFARTSMTVTNVFADKPSETDKSGQNLYDFLSANTFGKIFILLGINEISAPADWIAEKYKEDINLIRRLQPNAIIVIEGNPHVSQTVSDSNPNSFNNARIDALNDKLSQLADDDYITYGKIKTNTNLELTAAKDKKGNCYVRVNYEHVDKACCKLWARKIK